MASQAPRLLASQAVQAPQAVLAPMASHAPQAVLAALAALAPMASQAPQLLAPQAVQADSNGRNVQSSPRMANALLSPASTAATSRRGRARATRHASCSAAITSARSANAFALISRMASSALISSTMFQVDARSLSPRENTCASVSTRNSREGRPSGHSPPMRIASDASAQALHPAAHAALDSSTAIGGSVWGSVPGQTGSPPRTGGRRSCVKHL